MSLNNKETPLLHRFWKETGGTLIEEFYAARRSSSHSERRIDGVIIKDGENTIKPQSKVSIKNKDIVAVEVKTGRLGRYLMGQTLFAKYLLESFSPRSIQSVAVCQRDDDILRPFLESFEDIRVIIYED
jgi:hypothetical protein